MKKEDEQTCEMRGKTLTRRAFLGGAAAAGSLLAQSCKGPLIVPRHVLGGPGHVPPSEKLRIAAIGCGGRGGGILRAASGVVVTRGENPGQSAPTEHLAAFCDVDDERAAGTYKDFPNVNRYKDFRIMLEKEEKNIDAVLVCTPDHIHAPASMMAIKMGKHVFCEKPMSHSVYEARQLTEEALVSGVVTQMGIQGHAGEGVRLLCEWIWAGAIGPVREVHIWSDRPNWPQGIGRPSEKPPIPETLDWDLWLGPAPERPYNPAYMPVRWRGWQDFGAGALGDIGCHAFDCACWALDLGLPMVVHVEAETSGVNQETYPEWSIITYEFPARKSPALGDLPPVKLVWYDGGKAPARPPELEPGRNMGGNGHLFIGDEGKILTHGMYCPSPRIIPELKMRDFLPNRPEKTIPRSPGYLKEFVQACKGDPIQPGANFGYSGPLTELVHLGNLAIRVGRRIEWDPWEMRVRNDREAHRFVRREYRKGWVL